MTEAREVVEQAAAEAEATRDEPMPEAVQATRPNRQRLQGETVSDVAQLDGGPTLDFLRTRRQEILAVAGRHGARNIRVFGSVARGEANERSDVDLLIDLDSDRGLIALGGLYAELCDLLGIEVDVGTEKSLKDGVRGKVLAEAVPL